MDIWTGQLLLPNNTILEDIHLTHPHKSHSIRISCPNLRYLSTVNTSQVPLHLAAGPSLDVFSSSVSTCDQFEALLFQHLPPVALSNTTPAWSPGGLTQTTVGILARVEDPGESQDGAPRITEVLFYGASRPVSAPRIPTPPPSSPGPDGENPANATEALQQVPELSVKALPLSSDLIYSPSNRITPPSSPRPQKAEDEGEFISSFGPAAGLYSHGRKRKDGSDAFDDAALERRKRRRQGGESVAAAAARIEHPLHGRTRSLSNRADRGLKINTSAATLEGSSRGNSPSLPASAANGRTSRSPSISERPMSRKGLLENSNKRSSLSRVTSVSAPDSEPTVESRNKEAISRLVMAGMRLYGMQQRKRPKSARYSAVDVEMSRDEEKKDEEYKLVYHQIYRSTVVAFRRYINTEPLHLQPNHLRETVDKLLAIFCSDPMENSVSDGRIFGEKASEVIDEPTKEQETARSSIIKPP